MSTITSQPTSSQPQPTPPQLPITNSQFPVTPSLPSLSHLPPFLFPGHLNLLLGSPGTGKSLLALDLAARLSRGISLRCPPPSPLPLNPPAASLIISREDSLPTIRDRLHAAALQDPHGTWDGADLTLIRILEESSLVPDPTHSPLLVTLEKLQDSLPAELALLILDPLPAFLEGFDCHHASTIRQTQPSSLP